MDYSTLFGGGAPYIENGMGGINVSDYAMLKNGSYSDTLSKLFKSTFDEKAGEDKSYWESKFDI